LTEEDEKKSHEQRSGAGGGTGDLVRPDAKPEERTSGVEGEGSVREIPIGMPMDREEFKRRKAQAERPSCEEEEQEEADEDASTTQED